MSDHTPEPWIASSVLGMNGMFHIFIKTKATYTNWMKHKTQRIIARVDGVASEVTEDEVIANAQVIAAAPELLNICQRINESVMNGDAILKNPFQVTDLIDVIAKVTKS